MASLWGRKREKSFFSQMRRLCTTMEKEVAELQAMANKKKSLEDQSSAFLLLREIQSDVKNLKSEVKESYGRLQDDQGFGEALPICQKLLDLQKHRWEESELFLTQYGYKPLILETPTEKTDGTQGGEMQNDQIRTEKEESSNGTENGSSENATPLDAPCTPSDKLMPGKEGQSDASPSTPKTPKLEDFLGKDFLKKMADMNRQKKEQETYDSCGSASSESCEFKVPNVLPPSTQHRTTAQSVSETPADTTRWHRVGDREGIPSDFAHSGITVTPGIFSGKVVDPKTPMHMSGLVLRNGMCESPSSGEDPTSFVPTCSSDNTTGPIQMMALESDITHSGDSSGSYDYTSVVDQNQITKSPVVPPTSKNDNEDLDSPKAPVLVGMSNWKIEAPQISKQQIFEETAEDKILADPKIKQKENDFSSPIPPVLTGMSIKVVAKSEKNPEKPTVKPSKLEFNNIGDVLSQPRIEKTNFESSSENSPAYPNLIATSGYKPGKVHGKNVLGEVDSLENSPVMPELTATVEFSNAPQKPNLRKPAAFSDDDEGPAWPELYTTLSTSVLSSVPTGTTSALSHLHTPVAPPSVARLQQEAMMNLFPKSPKTRIDKENFLPSAIPPTPRGDVSFFRMVEILEEVGEEEYNAQPDYIRNRYTLPTINKLVGKINRLLTTKIEGGITCPDVCEEELSELGPSVKIFLLFMVKVERLSRSFRDGKVVYVAAK